MLLIKIMSIFKCASSCGPEFCESPSFLVLRYVREYMSYLDASHCSRMRASYLALTVTDRQRIAEFLGWSVGQRLVAL